MSSACCLEQERQLKHRLLEQALWHLAFFPAGVLPKALAVCHCWCYLSAHLGALHNVFGKRSDLYPWCCYSRNQLLLVNRRSRKCLDMPEGQTQKSLGRAVSQNKFAIRDSSGKEKSSGLVIKEMERSIQSRKG